MSTSSTNLPKPLMRGMLHKQIAKHLTIACVLCCGVGLATRIFLGNARKATYADFYKNYDIDKEFEEMREAGVFDSAK